MSYAQPFLFKSCSKDYTTYNELISKPIFIFKSIRISEPYFTIKDSLIVPNSRFRDAILSYEIGAIIIQ